MSTGLTLAVDGSTYAGSAAVIMDDVVLSSRELAHAPTPGRSGREEKFLPMVADCLEEAGVKAVDIERVICGSGPGSFTSLRVAASIAKGIAVGAGCPLFAVSSLLLIVAGMSSGRYLATMPAMRSELFAGLFEVSETGRVDELSAPRIIAESAVAKEAKLAQSVAITGAVPHARLVAKLLPIIIAAGECDIETWEPTYGRLAEAQVKWEAEHGRSLSEAG